MKLPSFSPAKTKFHAAHSSGYRSTKDIKYVVIHTTEGETAEGAASWFENPRSEGSANMVVGDYIAFRTLNDNQIPWAAPPLNGIGYHIEIAGFAAWTHDEWMQHRRRIENAAYRAALRCNSYRIPIFYRGPGYLMRKPELGGITTHADISKAFHQTDHTDPGINFPMDLFITMVQWYANANRL